MKQCNTCKQWKAKSEFNKRADTKDGLRTECRACQLCYNRKYYNTDKGKQKHKEYMNAHKEYYQNYEKKYSERRKELRQLNKLNVYIALNLCHSLRRPKYFNQISQYLDFTLQDLRQHLESQFTPSMSWNNYGSYWEIDHIIPQNLFNIQSPEDKDFKICWSLLNLRPLEKSTNRSRPKDGSDVSESVKQQILGQSL